MDPIVIEASGDAESIRLTETEMRAGRSMAETLGIQYGPNRSPSWRGVVKAILAGRLAVRRLEETGVAGWRRGSPRGVPYATAGGNSKIQSPKSKE